MYIQKLDIQHFGKYNKRKIELQKGMNVIYGPNEAGKTTIKDFITGMLYGIERQRGIAAKTDEYTRREPLDGSGYSGSMELEKDGCVYVVDRTFRKNQKTVEVYQQDTGRKLSLEEDKSLQGTLIDLDKNGYINTLCISSSGAAYKSELQEEFRKYLMNVNETHTGNLDLKDAYGYLNQQKKALNRKGLERELTLLGNKMEVLHLEDDLAVINTKRQEFEQQLLQVTKRNEEENLKAEKKKELNSGQAENAEQTKGTKQTGKSEQREESKWSRLRLTEQQKQQMDPQLKQILNFIKVLFAFGLFAIVLLLIYILPVSTHYKLWLCVIAVAVILYVWIRTEIKRYKQRRERADSVPHKRQESVKAADCTEDGVILSEKTKEKDLKEQLNIIEISHQLSDLQVQENDLLRKNAQQQELVMRYAQVKEDLRQAEQKAEAIDFAIHTIQGLAENIYDQYAPDLSRRVSDMVSRMTMGQYTDVRLDEKLNIQVRKAGRYLGAEFLSTGTLEQIYLAVRLAVAEEMGHGNMPLLLDDIFGAYDDARLEMALQCIAGYDAEQVILFTANDRLADALDQTDIEYNYIEI